jgi:hypothetical protein
MSFVAEFNRLPFADLLQRARTATAADVARVLGA